ncbi:MAG: mycothiol synthase [Acidimicrobiales bacterium]
MADFRVQVKAHVGPADLAEISDLLDAATRADGHRALSEHKWLDLVRGGRQGFVGFLAHEVVDAQLVGYAQLSTVADGWGLEASVHPAHRGWAEDIGRALLQSVLAEVGRHGARVHYWINQPTDEQDGDAVAFGFRPDRELIQLRRPIPLPESTRVDLRALDVRAFRPGTDEKAWLEVNNRAFAGHPEQGGWDLEALSEREAEPWFDPAGFLCAWEGDRLVGSCWTKCHTDVRPVLGEIYVISVDPEDHHRGLGRALTVAGLDWLAGNGVGTAMLYVDAANTGALAMYGSLGFTEDHRDRAYVIDVRPAPGRSG